MKESRFNVLRDERDEAYIELTINQVSWKVDMTILQNETLKRKMCDRNLTN